MTTHSIKADGTGDFVSAQSWETAVDGLALDTYVGEAYEGGDLASLTVADVTNGKTLILRPAAGHGHNGSLSDGAYMTGSGAAVAISQASNIEIRGMRLRRTVGGGSVLSVASSIADQSGIIIDGNLIESAPASGQPSTGVSVSNTGNGFSLSARVSNNIVVARGTPTSTVNPGISANATQTGSSGTPTTTTVSILNNTIDGDGKYGTGITLARTQLIGTGSAVLNATVRNNVVMRTATTDYNTSSNTGTGTLTITSSNNASEDSTADWAGGSGHVESIVPADQFTDPATDWSLTEDSLLLDAGFDLSGTFTNDAYGNTRDVPYNIGAWEGSFPEPPAPAVAGDSARTRCRTRIA